MRKLNRRDFLKLMGSASASLALQQVFPSSTSKLKQESSLQSIIIIVFDTMSAKNLSLYGYPRRTTPNLERFAERATVYHSHYSAGNYTVPGTASFLTGMYPWTHRAINTSGLIKREYETRNFFHLFGSAYRRAGFSQNVWANSFLNQFEQDIDHHLPSSSFSDVSLLVGEKFENDHTAAFLAFDNSLASVKDTPSSLILGLAENLILVRRLNAAQGRDYPRGLPGLIDYPLYFRLENVFDGVMSECQKLESPHLAYFHFWSPHEPYRPHRKFVNEFQDDLQFIPKAPHELGDQTPQNSLERLRRRYDQFIANVDDEFGRLMDSLQQDGILDRSYVIVTSDHGQMIERGVHGHVTPLLYEPIINIPLLISAPGQASRKDVYSPSVNIDVLPTLLQIAGLDIPDWCTGQVLPGFFGDRADEQRSLFSMEAKTNSAFAPFRKATVAMRKGAFKLISYFGYPDFEDGFELYDIEDDPEELKDLAGANPTEFTHIKEELLDYLADANRPFERGK
jgi:arylsulfatase A-like enzyme